MVELFDELSTNLNALVSDYRKSHALVPGSGFEVRGSTHLTPGNLFDSNLSVLARNHMLDGLEFDSGNMYLRAVVVLSAAFPEAELVLMGNNRHRGLELNYFKDSNPPLVRVVPTEKSAAGELRDFYRGRSEIDQVKDAIALTAMARITAGLI